VFKKMMVISMVFLISAAVATGCGSDGESSQAPALSADDAQQVGQELVEGLLSSSSQRDSDAFKQLTMPAFLSESAGSVDDRDAVIATFMDPATTISYGPISEVDAAQSGNALVVAYLLETTYNGVASPASSVINTFVWIDGAWKAVSFAS
jgi:hypothetical protein